MAINELPKTKTNDFNITMLNVKANSDADGIVKGLTSNYLARTVETISTSVRKELPTSVKENFPYGTDFTLLLLNNQKAIFDYLETLSFDNFIFEKSKILTGFGGIVQTIQTMLRPKLFRLLKTHSEVWENKELKHFSNADFEKCFEMIVTEYNAELDKVKGGTTYREKRLQVLTAQWNEFCKQETLKAKAKVKTA